MADLIWATTKNSTSVHFGFGHKCHKHDRLFDLEHIANCDLLKGCPDIEKYATMIKKGDNIRLWDQDVLADAIVQYTQLALQLANLTATSRATLVQTPVVKRAPTGNRRGRPKATEVIARTNIGWMSSTGRSLCRATPRCPSSARKRRKYRERLERKLWSTLIPAATPSPNLRSSQPR